jgi:hypothetical protein
MPSLRFDDSATGLYGRDLGALVPMENQNRGLGSVSRCQVADDWFDALDLQVRLTHWTLQPGAALTP